MAPNILLIIMDSVRARNVGFHGYDRDTTPFLDSLVDSTATRYMQARAPSVGSLPCHTSMFTGYSALEHGVFSINDRLTDATTVWEQLAHQGYATGVFSENPFLTGAPVGLKDSFQTVVGRQDVVFSNAEDHRMIVASNDGWRAKLRDLTASHTPFRTLVNGIVEQIEQSLDADIFEQLAQGGTGSDKYQTRLLDWIDAQDGEWAACINFMDTHTPYEPQDEFNLWGSSESIAKQENIDDYTWEFRSKSLPLDLLSEFESLYDGTIRQVDSAVENIINHLDETDQLDETLVVITSDHGEGFGEPSRLREDVPVVTHGNGIHESLVHVPLIIKFPHQHNAETVMHPVSLTSLYDIFLESVDCDRVVEFPNDDVISYAPSLYDKAVENARQFCGDDISKFDSEFVAVYREVNDDVIKYVRVEGDGTQYFKMTLGTEEVSIRGDEGREVVESVLEGMELADVNAKSGDLTTQTKSRLEDLGYI